MYKLLTINPGSTSTKIGVFENDKNIFEKSLRHQVEELKHFDAIVDQKEFRTNVILDALKENNIDIDSIDAFIGRGGLLKPVEGGTYEVGKNMLDDLSTAKYGAHASNLGAIISYELASKYSKKAYIVDPVVVDELNDVARFTGLKDMTRISIFHALNQKAISKRYAKDINKNYEDLNLVVAHLGGGISVGAHNYGRVIDVNNALDGDGPFSPERAGSLPVSSVYKAVFSGEYTIEQFKKKIVGNGGLVSYIGINDGLELSKRMEDGDTYAKEVCDAMCYQISKSIGEYSVALKGKVDAILITGGLAYNKYITDYIKEHVSFIADVVLYPGEDELQALAEGTLRVLNKEEKVKSY